MTERVDLYKGVHKGIRRFLGALVEKAGRTDFEAKDEIRALLESMRDVQSLLEFHAHHEDEFVMPLVRRYAPDVAARLDSDHEKHESRYAALVERTETLARAESVHPQAGHEVVVALSRLVGEMSVHMADEEELAQPVLWRTNDDVTLGEVHHALVSSIPPEVMARFLTDMLPAMNATERGQFVSRMADGAPVEAVRNVIALARSVLSADEMGQLERTAQAAFARAA